MSFEQELNAAQETRFLNNFHGNLPGGYRRSPDYEAVIRRRAPKDLQKQHFQRMSRIDEALLEMGHNIEGVTEYNEAINSLLDWSPDTEEGRLRNELKELFFDLVELPLYEKLLKKFPATPAMQFKEWCS